MSDAPAPDGATGQRTTGGPRRLAGDLVLYTLARIALVVVITAVIVLLARLVRVEIPFIVAALFAVIIAMPLSMVVFKGLRARVNADIAVLDERRRRDKAQLRARLRGADAGGTAAAAPVPDNPAEPSKTERDDAATERSDGTAP